MQSDLASSRNTFNSLVSILFRSIQARMLIKLLDYQMRSVKKKLFESFHFFLGPDILDRVHLYMFDHQNQFIRQYRFTSFI